MLIRSKVTTSRSGSESVKTTIPESIVQELGIKSGDTLGWDISIKKDGKFAVVVRLQK